MRVWGVFEVLGGAFEEGMTCSRLKRGGGRFIWWIMQGRKEGCVCLTWGFDRV